MRTCSAMVWIALAVSCGGDHDGEVSEPYASGTRLRARLYDGGDGAVLFGGWHDTELDLDCGFRLMDDGVWRCVPFSQGITGFADAACTQPIVVDFTDASCDPPARALELIDPGGCRQGSRMIGVGARLGDGPLFLRAARGCVDYSALGPYQRFAAGAPLDASGFVTATSAVEARGGGLAVTALTADDGARQLVEMIDPRRGPCSSIYDLTPTDFVCVANIGFEGGPFGFFVDDTCANDVPALYPACADRLPGAVTTSDGLHLPGARIPGPVHEDQGGTCALAEDKAAYEIGPRLMIGDLPAIAESLVGEGRLTARYYADVHGRPLEPTGMYDTAEESRCDVVVAGGTLRCLPWSVTDWSEPATLFADPACTVRVIALEFGFLERVAWMEPWCGGHREIETLRDVIEHTSALYESLAPGSCTSAVREPDLRYFADAEEIPFDTLPLITLRSE